MAKYRIVTDKGTYVIETAETASEAATTGAPGRFISAVGEQVNPFPMLEALVSNPKETIGGIVNPILNNPQKALGQMVTAPVEQAVGQFEQGNVAGGLGTIAGAALPYALTGTPNLRYRPKSNLNPVQASAVAYSEAQQIPIDLGTKTQNSFVQGTKRALQHVPGAAGVGDTARRATEEAMIRDLESLGGRLAPTGTTSSITAGESIVNKMGAAVNKFDAQADAAYTRLREIAESKAQVESLGFQRATNIIDPRTKQPVMADVTARLAGRVDVKPFKVEIAPILDEIEGKMMVNIPPDLKGTARMALMQSSPSYSFLRQIMDGPDVMDIATADRNLSYLKRLARNTDENPIIAGAMRNRSEGLAAKAIPDMEKQVSQGVSALGDEAIAKLVEGRTATIKKYKLADVVQQLRREPVQTFRQSIANKNGNIKLLRNIKENAPGAIPDIARAYLEGMIEDATPTGTVRARALLMRWKRMGKETKDILFGTQQGQIEDAFQLADMLKLDANPSGTAAVGTGIASVAKAVTAPLRGIPYLVGAKELARQIYQNDLLTLPTGTATRRLLGYPGIAGQQLKAGWEQEQK